MASRSGRFLPLLWVILPAILLPAGAGVAKAENTVAGDTAGPVYRVPFLTVRDKLPAPVALKDEGDDEDDETGEVEFFGGERGRLQAGVCLVRGTNSEALKVLADNLADVVSLHIPQDILSLQGVEEVSTVDFWQAWQQRTGRQPPVLYTHGYNIGFARGCERSAQFQRVLGLQGRYALFSWPSDGNLISYTRDEADLYWSVHSLHQVLAEYRRRFADGRANLVAHSLGGRGLMLALTRLAATTKSRQPLFDQLIFIAPDIDSDIFRQLLPHIRPLVKRLTVYVSANDSPLALSEQVHGHPRLGQAGEHLRELPGVEIIDVSALPVQSPTGHLYHLYNQAVIADLAILLKQNRGASQRPHLQPAGKSYWKLQEHE